MGCRCIRTCNFYFKRFDLINLFKICVLKATTDPKKVLESGGGLLPLGGSEEQGGYKGYGLTFMVDILCGILSGSLYGQNIRTWQTSSGEANLVSATM